jgi:hypothetical protein
MNFFKKIFNKKESLSKTERTHWRRDERVVLLVCLVVIVGAGMVIGDSFKGGNPVSAAAPATLGGQTLDWAQQGDYFTDMAEDSQGNIYYVGDANWIVKWSVGTDISEATKYTITQPYGLYVALRNIYVDSSDSVYVMGYNVSNGWDFDIDGNNNHTSYSAWNYTYPTALVIKYDSDLAYQWYHHEGNSKAYWTAGWKFPDYSPFMNYFLNSAKTSLDHIFTSGYDWGWLFTGSLANSSWIEKARAREINQDESMRLADVVRDDDYYYLIVDVAGTSLGGKTTDLVVAKLLKTDIDSLNTDSSYELKDYFNAHSSQVLSLNSTGVKLYRNVYNVETIGIKSYVKDGRLYVAGGTKDDGNYDTELYVINLSTFTLERTITFYQTATEANLFFGVFQIYVDDDRNISLFGNVEGNSQQIDFDPGAGAEYFPSDDYGNTTYNNTVDDTLFVKYDYDSGGDSYSLSDMKSFLNSTGIDQLKGMFIDSSGNLYVGHQHNGAGGSTNYIYSYLPANIAPTVTFNSQAQKTDGAGTVDVSVEVDDDDDDDVKLKVEYKAGADCSSGTSDPTLDETAGATADTSDSGGTPSVENDDTYQVGTTATRLIDTGSGINTVTFDWSSATDVASADGAYCIKITPNDGTTDGTAATETLTLDNANPTAAGNLTLNTLATTSLTYDFGVAGSDTNIDHYEVYYKAGASGVATSDTQIGSNIASGSYNADGTTSVSSLSANTQYVANIWTYDSYGNSGASSELVVYTAAAVPGAPTVDGPALTTLDVTLDVNSNPVGTEFAIQETGSSNYVQADGTLDASAVWKTAAAWGDGGVKTVEGLTANTQYTFKVKARNDDSTETAFGSTANAFTLANQVTSVAIADATTKSGYGVTLTWVDNSQTGMKIEQDSGCPGNYSTGLYDNASANETSSKEYSGLAGNTCYQFKISSYNGDGVLNSTSAPTSAQITTPPAQPTSLTALSNDTSSVTWSWDSVTGATDYNVYNNSGDSLIGNVGSSQSAYAQESLTANTAYTVYVRPTNANGTGIASSTATGYTEANIPINMSHSTQATDSVRWTWESGGAEKDFYAESTDPIDAIVAWTTDLYWDQSSLTANYLVAAKVKARNDNDEETSYASISRYTSQNTPSGITEGANTTSSITVTATGTFPNLTDGSSGLYFENTTSSADSTWIQTNSWTNSSLSANTAYAYRVKARNGDDDATAYSGSTTIYSAQNAPTATNIDSKTATTVTMSATGTFPNLAVGNSGLYFENTTASTDSGWLQVNTYTESSLTPNTQYTYTVKARNGDSDETAATDALNVYTLANVPGTPTLDNIDMLDLDLIIDVNSNSAATEYAIYDNTSAQYVAIDDQLDSDTAVWQTYTNWGGATGVTITELDPSGSYELVVKARNADETETAFSTAATTYTLAPPSSSWDSWGEPDAAENTQDDTTEDNTDGNTDDSQEDAAEDDAGAEGSSDENTTEDVVIDEESVNEEINEEEVLEEEVVEEVVEENIVDSGTSSLWVKIDEVLNEEDQAQAQKIIDTADGEVKKEAIEKIITQGNGESEQKLTARERLGLVEDFYEIYGRLPEDSDLEALDGMSDAQRPAERNIEEERKAISEFIRIYGRMVDFRNESDHSFIDFLSYRLRPMQRDLEVEKIALSRFVGVYRALPNNGWAWSIIRAIAYSGAK